MDEKFILNGDYNTQKELDFVKIEIEIKDLTLSSRELKYVREEVATNVDSSLEYISMTTTLPGNVGFNSEICAYETPNIEFAFYLSKVSGNKYRLSVRMYNLKNYTVTVPNFKVFGKVFLFAPPV